MRTDVVENLPDVGTVRDEGDEAHLASTQCLLFGTAVHQSGAVECLNAHTSVYRETTVLIAQRVFGITGNLQATAFERGQDGAGCRAWVEVRRAQILFKYTVFSNIRKDVWCKSAQTVASMGSLRSSLK